MARIGYLVPEWPTQTHAFFWRELSALRALGDEVVLLSTRRPDPKACQHHFAVEAHATTAYLFPPRLPTALRWLAVRPTQARAALAYIGALEESSLRQRGKVLALLLCAADLAARVEARSIEHLHVHSCADAAHVAALCHVLCGVPYSLTLHGDLPVYGVDHARKMAAAAFVVAVTRPLQQQLVQKVGLPVARAPVISMGVDTSAFQLVPRPLMGGGLHVVTVARLHPNKGHFQVLAAVKRAREEGLDIRYSIAGEGPFRPGIEAKIKELGLSACVRMCGSIGEQEVLALLAASDLFVLASIGLGEAAPVSVMEAMATGMPVLCTKIGGTADMIHDGIDGLLVEQDDVPALLAAFRTLATDPAARARLGAAAREQACRTFDHHLCAKQLHNAIHAAGGAIGARADISTAHESCVPESL